MPPKPAKPTKAEAAKLEEKKKKEYEKERRERKEREAADRTFGMKNKNKSKVVQEQIKQMTGGVINNAGLQRKKAKEEKAKKDAEAAAAAELEALFAAVPKSKRVHEAPKVVEGEKPPRDPKEELYELLYGNDPEILKLPVEERIEKAKTLIKPTTRLTTEVFMRWREEKKRQRAEKLEEQAQKRRAGNLHNGREIFSLNLGSLEDDASASAERIKAPEDAPESYNDPGSSLTAEDELLLLDEDDDDDELAAMLAAECAVEGDAGVN